MNPLKFPKPRKTRKSPPKRIARKPVKRVNAKRKGSRFPKVRDAKYRKWIRTEHQCLLAGRFIRVRMSMNDIAEPVYGYTHHCWDAVTPAHVGKTQATGAADRGCIVPLCQAAHRFYDERRSDWERVTRLTEQDLQAEAIRLTAQYVADAQRSTR